MNRRTWPRCSAVGVALLTLAACVTAQQPHTAQPEPPMVLVKTNAPAVFFMDPADRAKTFTGGASTFTGSAAVVTVPLGQYTEAAATKVMGAVFGSFRRVASAAEVPSGVLAVIARPGDFRWSGGFSADVAHLSLDIEAMLDGQKVFARSYRRDETSPTAWMGGQNIPPTAAAGVEKAMQVAVSEMLAEPTVQAYLADNEGVALAEAPRAPAAAVPAAPTRRSVAAPSKPRFPTAPAALSFPKGPEQPEDIAVVIGNADYGRLAQDVPDVVPAYADAEGFKRYAMAVLGVREGNIIDLRDATGAQMIRVFGSDKQYRGQLYDWVRPQRSRVYVYYAGHGAPGGADGSAYVVPVDADAARIELNGYPLSTLYSNLAQLPAVSVTVVLESCFSGVSEAGTVISNASPVYLKPKTPAVPPGLTVISAGAANQIASWEKDRSHSLFTKYYLQAVSGEADAAPYGNGDGRVDLGEVETYLEETLTYYARRYYGRDQRAQIVGRPLD